jgi:PAS domain-containing protein
VRVSPRVLAVVLLPAVAVLALGLPRLWGSLQGVAERVATDYLGVTLSVVTPMVSARLDETEQELHRWARVIAAHEALRITIIAEDGRVLADSSRTWEQVAGMDNHGGRPEVVEAARTGRGASVRRSETVGEEFVYVAQLLRRPDGRLYFVRLAEPLAAVAGVKERLTGIIWAVLAVSLATIGAVTVWLDVHLFRPLGELAAGADRMARGELAERIHVSADEALERVGGSLNRLARRVEEQVAAVEAERSHLEVVGASMSEGILVTDAEGKAQLANPSFRKLFRVKGDVQGRSAAELTLLAPAKIRSLVCMRPNIPIAARLLFAASSNAPFSPKLPLPSPLNI